MKLQQTVSERRLQIQQIDSAPTTDGKHAPNPFAAALGIGVIVASIWLLFALGRAIQELVVFFHKGDYLGFFRF